ncbi:hypothetical protein CISIN_1g029643mg [Citrus sinensis]|uniref:Uncharacterized protein n=1 Tax=Citrus sinensis TaxID=2711 RepID=A0A067D7J2_CITSI|nr:hypothetical protein CISIN_1g029643mg [Citrus sinensis]
MLCKHLRLGRPSGNDSSFGQPCISRSSSASRNWTPDDKLVSSGQFSILRCCSITGEDEDAGEEEEEASSSSSNRRCNFSQFSISSLFRDAGSLRLAMNVRESQSLIYNLSSCELFSIISSGKDFKAVLLLIRRERRFLGKKLISGNKTRRTQLSSIDTSSGEASKCSPGSIKVLHDLSCSELPITKVSNI